MIQQRKDIAAGTDDYSKLIDNNCYFVDKTPIMKNLFARNKSEVLLISRPRRFGKTLTMSMFYHFFSINHSNPHDISRPQGLFKDTKIYQDTEFCHNYMGKYPVVFLSLKDIEGRNFEDAYKILADAIYSLIKNQFCFLLESEKLSQWDKKDLQGLLDIDELKKLSSKEKIQSSLKLLTQLLFNHYGKKAIVLIDEYDVPLAKASVYGYYDEMILTIRGLLSSVLKTNSYLEKAILTGCLRVSKESIFTGLNNLNVNTVFDTSDKLSTSIGFTRQETIEMLNYYGLSSCQDMVQEWYDGYNFNNHEMFCAWDVVKFCAYAIDMNGTNEIVGKNFWINTSSNDLIYQFLGYLSEKDAEEMQVLVDGGTISKKIRETLNYEDLKEHHSDDFWSMLFYTGYLTVAGYSNFDVAGSELNLMIPNKSIRECFIENIQNYFLKAPGQVQKASKILECFFNAEPRQLRLAINDVLSRFISFRDMSTDEPKEYYYHGFLNGVFSTQASYLANYASNKEAGNGYADITFTSLDSEIGYVLELKHTENVNDLVPESQKAIKQIEEKRYVETFRLNGITRKVYGFGICFCKKSCFVSVKEYQIENEN